MYVLYCLYGTERLAPTVVVNLVSAPTVDPNRIVRHLGLHPAVPVVAVTGGSDTALWRVVCRDRTYALRIFTAGRVEACQREVAVMRAAEAAGIPVPTVYDMQVWHDHAVLLLAWCAGRTLSVQVRRRPWRVAHLGRLFGRAQAAIHRVVAPPVLLQHPEAWRTWADDLALAARLRGLPARADRLIHLDYHPLNVMTDGHRVTGVLDWTNARAGDPRADVARTTTILRLDSMTAALLPALERALVTTFERGWRAGYAGEAAPPDDNDEMAVFYAWAGAVMERDLAHKRGAEDLARIHRWTERWARQAGVR